jgi:hypothetical protein
MELYRTGWQQALGLGLAVLQGAGGAGLLLALFWRLRGKPPRRRRQAGPVAVASAVLLAAGAVGGVLARGLTAPRTTSVSTPERFRSSQGLALELAAPAGWRLEHQAEREQVLAFEGGSAPAQATHLFVVKSSPVREDVDLDRMIEGVTRVLEKNGMKFGAPAAETIAGKPGKSIVAGDGTSTIWTAFVARGRRHAGSIQCISRNGDDPRKACAPVLAGLTWLGVPGDN